MKAESNKLKEEMYNWMLLEMQEAEAKGRLVQIDGRPYSLADAEELQLVMEEGYYMKSYTGDENGNIIQIDFAYIGCA